MIQILGAKIQEIKITRCDTECIGSITLDADLIDAMGCFQYQKVHVNSKEGKGRIETYLLAGERGSKCCELNGGAANHFKKGEIVHVLAYIYVYEFTAESFKPKII